MSDLGRMPPHNQALEQAVVGAMLLEGNAIDSVRAALPEDAQDFWYDKAHALLCEAIFKMRDQERAVDQLTLTEELRRRDELDKAGGVVYLAKLGSEVATTANVSYHMGLLTEYYIRRRLISLSGAWAEEAYTNTTPPAEVLIEGERRLRDLIASCQRNKAFVTMEDALHDHIDYMEKLRRHGGRMTGIPSGFVDLDDATAGWQKSDLIVLAARPSVGKTALALALARNAAESMRCSLVFSLEMAQAQLTSRMVCAEGRIDSMRARRGRLTGEELDHMAIVANNMAAWPIYFNDTPGLTVAEIRAMARTKKREIEAQTGGERTLDMVVVDYLQLVHGGVRSDSREQEVAYVSRELKALAKDLDIPVIALAQLNRSVEMRTDRKPQLSDLRDSGEIEQNADLVLLLYRPGMYEIKGVDGEDLDDLAQIIIAKQRNGPTCTVNLRFEESFGTFSDNPYE